jgi:hypothetical protein
MDIAQITINAQVIIPTKKIKIKVIKPNQPLSRERHSLGNVVRFPRMTFLTRLPNISSKVQTP